MKTLFTGLLLLSLIIAGGSFKTKRLIQGQQFKNEGYLMAVIDGKIFEVRDQNKYTAELMNKSGDAYAMNGSKLTRVATSVNFYGSDYRDDDNNVFTEGIGFEYSFNDGALGEPGDQKIILNYNNQKFYSIARETTLKITRIEWSKDRRYFTMNADFDCRMRKWGTPADAQTTIRLKGKMEKINVTVPAWIIIKNPNQMASE